MQPGKILSEGFLDVLWMGRDGRALVPWPVCNRVIKLYCRVFVCAPQNKIRKVVVLLRWHFRRN